MGRLISQKYTEYGSWDGSWLYPGSTLQAHPGPHPTPGTPPPTRTASAVPGTALTQTNSAVGLRSVAQLSLGTQISDNRTITEVYNLLELGNPNDHFLIAGNE